MKMPIENHIQIHHILLFHFEKCWNAVQSFRNLNELFGEGTISKSQVERWFNKFKSGDTNLVNEEGKGRQPGTFCSRGRGRKLDNQNVDRRLQCDHSTIVCRLKKLGKVWKLAGWVATNSPATTKPNVSEFSPICCSNSS